MSSQLEVPTQGKDQNRLYGRFGNSVGQWADDRISPYRAMYFLALFAFSCAASCPGAPAMPMTSPGAICCQRRYSSGVQAPDAKVSGGSRVMVADQNRRRGNFVIAESASIIRDLWLHTGLAGHGPRLLY